MGRLLLVACTSVGRAIIETIKNNEELKDVDLVGLVNLDPIIAINKANYDPYTDLIEKYQIKTFYCTNINDVECVQFMKDCLPDIILQSGWSQKFSEEVLNIPRYACIGEHPAPLPKGRGAACVNWAIITGETTWGDTFFKMEMKYDTGDIYGQDFFQIESYDDVKSVYDKVAGSSVNIVNKYLLDWTKGNFQPVKQKDEQATHYPRRKPSDGEFDFSQNSVSIYNQIRGQAKPYPGAFFYIDVNGNKIKMTVWKASLDTKNKNDGGKNITCGDGKKIRILRVQAEGKPECWATDCELLSIFEE